MTDIRLQHPEHRDYVISYEPGDWDQTLGGVMLVRGHGALPIHRRDLTWLLEQPGLPDEFRRAASVHLER